jgi:PAS domain S-box-containing protein
VGLLGLANKPGGFTDEDARIAAAFGEIAAIALDNSRMLQSLESSEERFRAVAQSAGDAIVSADQSGRIIFWNPAASRIFGYPADEVQGQSVTLLMPEAFREEHQSAMARLAAGGPPSIVGKTVELRGLRRDGGEFPIELSLASWKTHDGLFFTSVIRDITERKRLEAERSDLLAAITQERDFIDAVLDIVGALVIVLDRGGRIVRFNRTCERTTGYSFEELRGREFFDLFLPPEEAAAVRAHFLNLRAGQFPGYFQNHWLTRDGLRRLIAWSNTALISEGVVEHVIGTGIDVTEQKRAEEEREEALRRERAARQEAEAAAELRERLMAILGHDLRQPLSVIYVAAGLLSRRNLNEQDARAVERIDRSVRRITAMIRDLLDFTRCRSMGGIPVAPGPCDLKDLLPRIIEEIRAAHPEPPFLVEIVGDCAGLWDSERLFQLFANLFANAVQHGAAGAPIRLRAGGDGEGVSAEASPRGLGLGLYISHEIARAHGGAMDVRSSVEEGTTFIVRLPCASAALSG